MSRIVQLNLFEKDIYTCTINYGDHTIQADEPQSLGGRDLGLDPYALLHSSLASCTAITMMMYAKRKQWKVSQIRVQVTHSRLAESERIDAFHKEIQLIGELDEKQKQRMLQIAEKCPVNKTLKLGIDTSQSLVSE